ncbi:hypothetical protein ACWC5C_38670 [Streptomyces sp. NPDC001700]
MRRHYPVNPLPPSLTPPPTPPHQRRSYTGLALLILAVAAAICAVSLMLIATVKIVTAVLAGLPGVAISLAQYYLHKKR